MTPGQAQYEELSRCVGSEYDSWEKLPGDLRAAHESSARAAISVAEQIRERDSITERIAELRVMLSTLSTLADRAEASGAITGDEADEYRRRGGLAG